MCSLSTPANCGTCFSIHRKGLLSKMPEYDMVYTCTQAHMNQCNEGLIMSEERNMVNLTLTVTREERKALKQLALDNETTVSALLRQWLKEHLEKEKVAKD